MSFLKKLVNKAVSDVVKEVSKSSPSSKTITTAPKSSTQTTTSTKKVVDLKSEYERLQQIIDQYEAENPGLLKLSLVRDVDNPGISLSGVNKLINNEIYVPSFITKIYSLGNWEKEQDPIRIVFDKNIKLNSVREIFARSNFNILDVSNFDLTIFSTLKSLFMNAKIKTLTGLDKWSFGNHTDLTQLFFSSKIDNFEGLNDWDVSNIENFTFMFRDIQTENLDISKWVFNKIVTTENSKDGFGKSVGLFQGAKINNFASISNWNISKVTNMVAWFTKAKIKELDLSNWDVSNVKAFTFLFEGFNGKLIGIDNWNTSSATSLLKTFSAIKLENDINLSNWNTSNVTTMHCTFRHSTLNNQDLSNWNTSNVTEMSEMFDYCKIESVGDLSNWNTSKVENFTFMFGHSLFTSVGNIGSWNVCNADVTQMFGRAKLTSIGSIDGWKNNKHQEHMTQGSNIK